METGMETEIFEVLVKLNQQASLKQWLQIFEWYREMIPQLSATCPQKS